MITTEFIESESYSELIPYECLDNELFEKLGKQIILIWFLVEETDYEEMEEEGIRYQEMYVNQIHNFSTKLNHIFLKSIINKQNFNCILDNKRLIFKLKPIEPPQQKSRISWWDSNLACFKYKNSKWEICEEKRKLLNSVFGKILRSGEVKIKNVS